MLRVVVIGAHRRRQGVGPHLARFFAQGGAEVVGIVGTTPRSVTEALEALAEHGMTPRGSIDVRTLLAEVRPDIVVIASPASTHGQYLQAAAEAGVHVLCEKPLCWGGPNPTDEAARLVETFHRRGLHLHVNTQWPYTLDAYRGLHPEALRRPPTHFAMRLSPGRPGESMIPDAMPHVLSLLLAVLPDRTPEVRAVRIRQVGADDGRLEVAFDYVAQGHTLSVEVDLRRGTEQPREAGYGFDGHFARRIVEMEDYALFFEGGGRRVSLPDPTPVLVRSFLARVSSGEPPVIDLNSEVGMALLEVVHAAWPPAGASN